MDNAGELEAVAGQMRQTATRFTNTVNSLGQQTSRLDAIAQDLTTGTSQWAGKGSTAFLGAWSQYHQDTLIAANTLAQAALSLTALAQTIEDNTSAIATGQAIQSVPYVQEQNPGFYQSSMQAMQAAELAIAMMAANSSTQLEALTPQVGTCSEPESGIVDPLGNFNANDDGGGSGNTEGDDTSGQNTEEPTPSGSLKLRDDKWLKQHGVDPHEVKNHLGKGSDYDIYVDRDGNLFALRKKAPQSTAIWLGNLSWYK